MIKRSLVLVLIMLFQVLSVSAEERPDQTRIRVVASFYPVYIMALNVLKAVPGVSLVNLSAGATGCLHDYALTTDNMKILSDADIFIANGAGMESFLDHVAAQYPSMKSIRLSDGIILIKDPATGGVNPHVWLSVPNARQEVQHLAEFMMKVDPVYAPLYQQNAREYSVKLDALNREMHHEIDHYAGRKIITFHEAFPYFASEFNLEIAAVVEREPGSEPSARELASTIDIIRNSRIKVIFTEPQYAPGAAETISRETGADIFYLDPVVSGPAEPDAYLAAMRQNLAVLKKALAK